MQLFGMAYSPTWNGYYPGLGATVPQLSDSDFANEAFQALWNFAVTPAGNYRNDLYLISLSGATLIRLYNWGPTRGWNGTSGSAHIGFLDYAQSLGLQVIVPVSNYFLSDDQYAWNGNDPDATYSWASGTADIQADLTNFLSSVTVNGQLHPAVHSFSVGNEIDINTLEDQGTSGVVAPASRLARTIWWMINLNAQAASQGLGTLSVTSPISNADQGGTETTPPSYWFGAFVGGVSASTPLPVGTTGGSAAGTFGAAWSGLDTVTGYASWYYNSVNIYQYGSQLSATLAQYDAWTSSTQNNINWPGQQFSVPLMLTEIGVTRSSNSQAGQTAQAQAIISGIAQTIVTYWSTSPNSLLVGYCLYEFNDEPYMNANWGIWMQPDTVAFESSTGATVTSWTTFPAYTYPVDDLQPVVVDSTTGQTLFELLAQTNNQLAASR